MEVRSGWPSVLLPLSAEVPVPGVGLAPLQRGHCLGGPSRVLGFDAQLPGSHRDGTW